MTEISKLFFQFRLKNTLYIHQFTMPELPDLQAFIGKLSRKLVGKKVEKINAINKVVPKYALSSCASYGLYANHGSHEISAAITDSWMKVFLMYFRQRITTLI
ncbi:MAG: hypothetical protein WD824_25860, partial [Cyclobacteriaceae bacterium]